jgi:hypothetical protein
MEFESLKAALKKNTGNSPETVLIPVTLVKDENGSNVRGYIQCQLESPGSVMEKLIELLEAGWEVYVYDPYAYKKSKFNNFSRSWPGRNRFSRE